MQKTNSAAIKLIKESEGLRLKAYLCPAGVWTIGYGCTEGVRRDMVITELQAEQLFKKELNKFEIAVTNLVKVPLAENQFSALVSFTYNVGMEALRNSTLLKLLNQGNYLKAADEFPRWNKAGGKVLPGLVTRRAKERALFLIDEPPTVPMTMIPPILRTGKFATIKVLTNTFLKGECKQAKDLSDDKKSTLVAGIEFQVTEWYEQSNHYHLVGDKVGWIFKDHCQLISATPSATNTLADRIVRYMEAKGYQVFKLPKHYNIVYVEGMNADGTLNNDAPNEWNDLRLVIEFQDGVPKIVGDWISTTEPGSKFTYNPMNSKGAARIKFGQYQAWQVGFHGSGNARHEALVQVCPITVHRDFDKNFLRTGDKLDTGLFGCNQHWGYDYPLNDIRGASAGCLVGRTTSGHQEFMGLIKQDARYEANKNYIFFATVIPGDDLIKL